MWKCLTSQCDDCSLSHCWWCWPHTWDLSHEYCSVLHIYFLFFSKITKHIFPIYMCVPHLTIVSLSIYIFWELKTWQTDLMFHEIVELLYKKKPTHNLEIPTYIIQSKIGKHFSYFSHLEVSVVHCDFSYIYKHTHTTYKCPQIYLNSSRKCSYI